MQCVQKGIFLNVKDVTLVGRIVQKLGKTPSYHSEDTEWNSLASVQVRLLLGLLAACNLGALPPCTGWRHEY